ncbi:hypothetical protein ABBQ32_013330 [Trebouxia sp. C0010 RCD-2024]
MFLLGVSATSILGSGHPQADLESGSAKTTGEAAISCLLDGVLREKLPNAWAGAEWWVQVYEPGKGLAFHFDKDEHAMKEKQQMIQPALSSVLYLSGDCTQERLGPTAVIDQLFDAEQGRAVPASPEKTVLIFPYMNQYVLFDGRLGHGVLGSSCKQPRMTMLINWWTQKPQDVSRITDEVIQQHSLSNPTTDPVGPSTAPSTADSTANLPSTLQQLDLTSQQSPHSATAPSPELHTHQTNPASPDQTGRQHPQAADAAAQQKPPPNRAAVSGQPPQHLEDPTADSNGRAAGDGKSSAGVMPAVKQKAGRDAKQLPVPCASIVGWDESPVSVDDVFQTFGLTLTGPKAVHAVAIEHSGFELFPLDEENLEANAGNIVTAAAFVPAGMVSDQSDSGSSHSD